MVGKEFKRILVMLCATSALVACGGGEEEGPQKTSLNSPPTVSGVPDDCVGLNNYYEFIADGLDADNDSLKYSIINQPSWTSFNIRSGKLSGTTNINNVGLYDNIQISVTDGIETASLDPFAIEVLVGNGQTMLTWTPPITHEDGTTLIDLAGYKIYYGKSAYNFPNKIEINNPGQANYLVENLCPTTYFFAVTAITASSVESGFSAVEAKLIN